MKRFAILYFDTLGRVLHLGQKSSMCVVCKWFKWGGKIWGHMENTVLINNPFI